ncbi:hypothetical protein [Marinobacter orientalis]|uniref:Uncharacterized protein n=1 Tax=Marinobacter orientalis TaxID=1928859 RepID=A0A7Y0WS14_9GAMM|nr:hypothetical protein [Marinobacter orientalis]NMT63445.1 hypothetical protein [Marinobacter orientalis]TGX48507.1 hypothetical protein DIT72_14025 [Marinobacter orientalis]
MKRAINTNVHHALVGIALFAWAVMPLNVADLMFYPFLICVIGIIARAGYEQGKLRRRAWLRQYLKEDSILHRRLSVGLLSWLVTLPVATFLAFILLLNIRSGDWGLWLVLLTGFIVFIWAKGYFVPRLESHVVEDSLASIGRKVSILPTAGAMITLFVILAQVLPHPNVEGMAWPEMIRIGTSHIQGVGLLPFLERMFLALTLTEYWAMQNAIQSLGTPLTLNLMGWTLFFLSQCAFIWAFCRLLAGTESLKARLLEIK